MCVCVCDYIYLSLHCHHQNDFCIEMGSEESHFNVSVGSDGQSHCLQARPCIFQAGNVAGWSSEAVEQVYNTTERGVSGSSLESPDTRTTTRPATKGLFNIPTDTV